MYRRTLITILVFLFLLPAFVCSAESASALKSAKDEICSLIDSGRFSQASTLVDKLIIENESGCLYELDLKRLTVKVLKGKEIISCKKSGISLIRISRLTNFQKQKRNLLTNFNF